MPDLLIEIGCEELPARFIDQTLSELGDKVTALLDKERIAYNKYALYTTPRRLAILVESVAEKQEDLDENVRGPSLQIARTKDGEWSPAALGFAKKNRVNIEDLYEQEFKGAKYAYARIFREGAATTEILQQKLPQSLSSMELPYVMRWGSGNKRFVRPIRWLVALFGDKIVPFTWAGVTSGNVTYGHRFLGSMTEISTPKEYTTLLKEEYVVADADIRRDIITNQLREIEEEKGWIIPLDADLLSEVVHLVEYPVAVIGSFQESFLQLPIEVLITSMREHQRYFYVEDDKGNLLPFFITISNGYKKDTNLISKGNEKVLSARLADAKFFFDADKKNSIEYYVEKLKKVLFQKDLGTVYDKTNRLYDICRELESAWRLVPEDQINLMRAAKICKFALTTQMVGEFPELEGSISRIYANYWGENPKVAYAIDEHYTAHTSSELGDILYLVDKMDTLAANFGIGKQPTGSQDPYALRRQAFGIAQILLKDRFSNISLDELIEVTLKHLQNNNLLKLERYEVKEALLQFFALRFKKILKDKKVPETVISSILSAGIDKPSLVIKKSKELSESIVEEDFNAQVDSFSRVANLANKADNTQINTDLFKSKYEETLYSVLQSLVDTPPTYDDLKGLCPHIDAFFDNVMVMVEDKATRCNRLALLREVNKICSSYAIFAELR